MSNKLKNNLLEPLRSVERGIFCLLRSCYPISISVDDSLPEDSEPVANNSSKKKKRRNKI